MECRELAEKFCSLRLAYGGMQAGRNAAVHMGGEFGILLRIYRLGEEISVGGLTRLLGLSFSRTTNALNALEQKGYVRRVHDLYDRRKVYVTLTEAGRDCARARYQEMVDFYSEVIRRLGVAKAEEYYRLSRQIGEIYKEMRGGEPKTAKRERMDAAL